MLDSHKIKYVPNKQAYLNFMFEFVYQLTSMADSGCPVSKSNQFIPRMRDFLEEDFHYAKEYYYKHNTPYVITVPPVSKAKEHAQSYIKRGWIVTRPGP
jgi:hypothetical protein